MATYQQYNIVMFSCDYIASSFSVEMYRRLNLHFPDALQGAVSTRQAEFLVGRYCARYVLRELGSDAESVPIGLHRSPVWPRGVVASISHTGSSAVCVGARSENVECLGVDLAEWLTPSVAAEIQDSVISSTEKTIMAALGLSFERALTLVFSAKESLFKALHPGVGFYFDFDAAQITEISMRSGYFRMTLTRDLTTCFMAGRSFTGFFSTEASHIQTIVFVTNEY